MEVNFDVHFYFQARFANWKRDCLFFSRIVFTIYGGIDGVNK